MLWKVILALNAMMNVGLIDRAAVWCYNTHLHKQIRSETYGNKIKSSSHAWHSLQERLLPL
jgi:hypothetical protein